MNTKVEKAINYGNQVVLIGTPNRHGLQVMTIETKQINPSNPNENILFQLVTKDGNEIDYSLIPYYKVEKGK